MDLGDYEGTCEDSLGAPRLYHLWWQSLLYTRITEKYALTMVLPMLRWSVHK
jgi:hypothetical protein